MITLLDGRGQRITLARPPRRIVSLVPSQTELLYSLGLEDEVVGITRFCVHPAAWRESKMIVGGTKLLRTDRVRDLKPDLIFANLEENTREDVERIEKIAPVFVTNVGTLDEAIEMIESVSLLVDRVPAGRSVASAIQDAFESLNDELVTESAGRSSGSSAEHRKESAPGSREGAGPGPREAPGAGSREGAGAGPGSAPRQQRRSDMPHDGTGRAQPRRSGVRRDDAGGAQQRRSARHQARHRRSASGDGGAEQNPAAPAVADAAYLIWRDPYMSVGGDTFIHDMMQRGGFANVFGSSMRYPQITISDLIDADPSVVFLSSEPFPFVEKHLPEIEGVLPRARVHLVDGQLFSWYGSRLIHTPDYLRRLRTDVGLRT